MPKQNRWLAHNSYRPASKQPDRQDSQILSLCCNVQLATMGL